MAWLNECTSIESSNGGQQNVATIGIKPRAHWAALAGGGRILREIASDWVQGDAELPHLVAESPIRVGTADSGRRRLYPVPGDLTRYIEIGAPLIKPAGSWVSVGFANATRTGNRITWSRPQANMTVTHGGHFIKLDIELLNNYVPPNSQFAFPATLVGLTRDGARILADGKPVMLMRPPVVYDAANPLDVRPITSTFGAIGGQTGVLFTLPSLAGMARPVVDPTFSSQPAAAEGTDTYINEASPTFNYGIATANGAGDNGAVQKLRGLLAFSLSGIPASAVVASATVALRFDYEDNTTDRAIGLHRGLTQWFEGVKNGTAPDAGQDGSTWNLRNANGSVAWAGGAGGASGSDYSASATDTQTIANMDTVYTWTITADVQAWLRGTANYGWWLSNVSEGVANALKACASSDRATAADRPSLEVTYTLPSTGLFRPWRRGL